jgi:hypothetical protein
MGGTTEVRNVTICLHFPPCYLLVPAITANSVWIPFVNSDGLILTVCYNNANLCFSLQGKLKL